MVFLKICFAVSFIYDNTHFQICFRLYTDETISSEILFKTFIMSIFDVQNLYCIVNNDFNKINLTFY